MHGQLHARRAARAPIPRHASAPRPRRCSPAATSTPTGRCLLPRGSWRIQIAAITHRWFCSSAGSRPPPALPSDQRAALLLAAADAAVEGLEAEPWQPVVLNYAAVALYELSSLDAARALYGLWSLDERG